MSTNYSKKELKKSLLNKMDEIKKLNISSQEKRLMLDKYYSEYKLAKTNIVDNNSIISNRFDPKNNFNQFVNMFNLMHNEFNNPNTKSYSIQNVLNHDGTRTVIESTNNIIDGKSNKKTTSYKIDSTGNKILIKN